MKKDILLAIAAHTRAVPIQRFEMEIWKNKCGTVGCAIGHATSAGLIPELTLIKQPYPYANPREEDFFWKPLFGQETTGFYAVGLALDISTAQAEYLFSSQHYDPNGEDAYGTSFVTPDQVADRIEYFANSDGDMSHGL